MKISQEKLETIPMHFFFLGGGGRGKGVKQVYYGICASRVLHYFQVGVHTTIFSLRVRLRKPPLF